MGTMQAGLQYEHIKREKFEGLGGAPNTSDERAVLLAALLPVPISSRGYTHRAQAPLAPGFFYV